VAACETNWIISAGVPISTFIVGFLVSWLTLSKKDRLEHKQRLYQNAKDLAAKQESAYSDFTASLTDYNKYPRRKQRGIAELVGLSLRSKLRGIRPAEINAEEVTMNMFINIATTGDNYFRALKNTAEAIMSNSVEAVIRDNTLIPMLKEAAEKTIPTYYEQLNKIAIKKGFSYKGELKRSNFKAIYNVTEKFT